FTRLLDAKNKLPRPVFFSPGEGVEAVGQHQVRFHLARPFGPLLAMLTQATEIVNEKALKEKDPKLFPIGTGPYRFVEWVKDDHVTLERWDKYFRPGRPYIDRIVFYAPADDTVRLTGLQTGRFNWIQTVPPQRISELERGRDPKASPGGPDVARARQLLSEAGAGAGLTLTYLVKSQVPVLVKTGEILREELKKVGIALDVQPLESGQYFEALVGKKFDIAAAWWSVTVDPDMFYSPLQHSTSPWNFSGFKSEEADKRIDAFRFTTSPAARKKMYPELVRWFQEEGSLIVFSNEIQRYWMKPNIHGSAPLPSQFARWLAGLVRGDFGLDFRQNEPIGRMILDRLPVTVELTVLASAGAALIGIPLGLLGGARRRGLADRATLAIGLVGVSI